MRNSTTRTTLAIALMASTWGAIEAGAQTGTHDVATDLSPIAVSIEIADPGMGKVLFASGDVEDTCTASCTLTVARGERLRLKAVPTVGNEFVAWDAEDRVSGNQLLELSATGSERIRVAFAPAYRFAEADRDGALRDAHFVANDEMQRLLDGQLSVAEDPHAVRSAALVRAARLKEAEAIIAEAAERSEAVRTMAAQKVSGGRLLEDGNVEIPLTSGDRVVLLGDDERTLALADSIKAARDDAQANALYALTFQQLPVDLGKNLPLPDGTLTSAEVRTLLAQIASDPGVKQHYADALVDDLARTVFLPPKCADEVYDEGKGFDRGIGKSSFAPNGLHANFSFPLKNYTTCVKYQGVRGSCSAFAQIAALETVVARESKSFVNLSEQHLYWRAKTAWEFGLSMDGASGGGWAHWGLAEGFKVGVGTAWLYNQSLDRDELQGGGYEDSCLGYSFVVDGVNYCSDTAGQGVKVCTTIVTEEEVDSPFPGKPGKTVIATEHVCHWIAPDPGSVTYAPKQQTPFWDVEDADGSVELMKTYLDMGLGVVIGFDVYDRFAHPYDEYVDYYGEQADTRGFVVRGGLDDLIGAHGVQVVGYVDATSLPADFSNHFYSEDREYVDAIDGFFIVKNSWGVTWGDNGFAYVPYSYFRVLAHSAYVMTGHES